VVDAPPERAEAETPSVSTSEPDHAAEAPAPESPVPNAEDAMTGAEMSAEGRPGS
jgi:hypothetical protein